MRPNEKILELYNEQSKFGYIESLSMCKLIEAEEITINLRITFFSYPCTMGDRKMVAKFIGIKELKLNELEGLYKTIFTITDISSYQLENIRYTIVEEEHNILRFSCRDFKISFI